MISLVAQVPTKRKGGKGKPEFAAVRAPQNEWAADYLKRGQAHAKLTGVELAARLTEETGQPVSGATLSNWQSGRRSAVSAAVMLAVAKVTGLAIDYPPTEEKAVREELAELRETLAAVRGEIADLRRGRVRLLTDPKP